MTVKRGMPYNPDGSVRAQLESGNSITIGSTATHTYYADSPAGAAAATVEWTISRKRVTTGDVTTLPTLQALPATPAAAEALSGWPTEFGL